MEEPPQMNSVQDVQEAGFNVLDIVLLFTSRWRLIVGLVAAFALLGAVGASFRSKKYTARSTFTTQSEQATGGVLFLGRQQDPTTSLLKSNSVADYVVSDSKIEQFGTGKAKVKNPKLYFRSLVQSETKVKDSGDGVYVIEVSDPIAERGVAIANGFLAALQDMSFRMNAESAVITRRFFESQVAEARQRLESAEQQLRDAQARTGLLQPGSQTGQELGQMSALRSQLTALQVQRATLSESATDENPEMVRLGAQIAETQARLAALNAKTHRSDEGGIPTQNLELTRLERNVTEQQAVVTSLLSQYERAQLQERFTAPKVRTVDRAELPLPPSSRNTPLLTAVGAALGLLISTVILIASEVRRRLTSTPEDAQRIHLIRQSLAWKRR